MKRVDQYVHTFRARDAVSDEARVFRDRLRERGFVSSIVAIDAEAAVAHDVEIYDPRRSIASDAAFYHHATAADLGLRLARWHGRKALLYHGVTPPGLIRPYQPAFAALLDEGCAALRHIARHFSYRFADSRFGAGEVHALTGCEAGVLPFCLDTRRFAAASGKRVARVWRDGVRWLTVGRIAPNKGLLALVAGFASYALNDRDATLTLVGAYASTDPYYWAVRRAIDAAGMYGRIRLTGAVDDARLVRWYETSDVYVCLSEHEGFCVPLIEAMHFDLPIVALARAAVPETLGAGVGVVIPESSPRAVAAAVASLGDDRRRAVLRAQRVRRDDFAPARALAAFDQATEALLAV